MSVLKLLVQTIPGSIHSYQESSIKDFQKWGIGVWIILRTKGEGVKNLQNFADVLFG